MEKIEEIRKDVEWVYSTVNNFVSAGVLPILDIAYPNHDGIQDVDNVSELMLLRDRLNSLAKACIVGIEHLNEAIND